MSVDMVTGDWHLNDNIRDQYRHDFVRNLPGLLMHHNVQRLIVLGDITEEKDRHPAVLVNRVVRYFHELSKQAEVYMLLGNHDYLDEANPFFKFLRHLRVKFISAPRLIGSEMFLPHTVNHKRDWAGLDFSRCSRIFAHNTFDGAVGNNGMKLNGLPTDIFPDDAEVYSGDIHTPQKIGPITYAGAPYLIDFGDDYEPRVLLLNKDKITSIPTKGPQKRLVNIKLGQTSSWSNDVNRGDILKVRVRIKSGDMAKWQEIRARTIKQVEKLGCVPYSIHPLLEQKDAAKMQQLADATKTRSDVDVLEDYAEHRSVDDKTLDAGLKLLDESKK